MSEKIYIKSSTQLLELAKKSDVDDSLPQSTFDLHLNGSDPYRHPTKDIDFPIEDNVSVFNTLQESLNRIWSTGVITGCHTTLSVTINSVDVSAGDILLRRTNDEYGELVVQHSTENLSIGIVNNTEVLIYAEYQGIDLLPLIKTTTNFGTVEGNLRTVVALVTRYDDEINIIERGEYNINHPHKNTARLVALGMQHIPGGTVTGANIGTLSFNITAGGFYLGVSKFEQDAFNSSAGDTFTYWYETAPNVWTKQAGQQLLSNAQYATGSGLSSLTNNNWGTSWIYATTSDTGLHVHVLYGFENEVDRLDAEQAAQPSRVPEVLTGTTAVLLGRAVIQEGAAEPFVVASVYAVDINQAAATSHNYLSGLQGGGANEFYHLTSDELTKLQGEIITWLPSWVSGEYPALLMTRDGDWTMISNKTTSERPSPQEIGDKQYGVDPDGVFTESQNTSVVRMLHKFVLDKGQSGYVEAVKVRLPVWDKDSYSRVTIANITANTVTVIDNPILKSDEWTYLAIGSSIITAGTEFLIQLEFYNSSATAGINGGWTSNVGTGEPSAQQFNIDSLSNPTVIEISHTDLDGLNRSSELDGVSIDSIMNFHETADLSRSVEVQVTGVPDLTATNSTKYPVTLITLGINGSIRGNKTTSVDIDIPISQPSLYNRIADHFVTYQPDFATISSELYYGAAQQPSLTDAYGIDVVFQQASISNDWDLIALSGGSGGSGSGVDTFSALKDTPPDYITHAGKSVIVSQDELYLEYNDMLDSPALTGNPTAPTPTEGDNDTSIATTEFVQNATSDILSSPVFTGDPTAPTPPEGDNDTSIATTEFVQNVASKSQLGKNLLINGDFSV
ncbi:MAG: hypothetical protein DRQ47_09675, partial [Gammaproteobacteria bacterium]